MTKPKLIIFGDPKRRYAAEAVEDFVHFAGAKAEIITDCFRSCDKSGVDVLKEADFAVVFGGDGTILSTARELSEADVPVIGVNVGKLGFLAQFSAAELKQLFDRITSDKSLIEKRMILSCSIWSNGSEKFSSTAINDVVIAAGAPFSMVELKVTVQGQSLAGCTSDGIIISTPTG